MPSFTELKDLFIKKYATLSDAQKEKYIFNPGEEMKPLSWNDVRRSLDTAALEALYRARIIKR